MITYLVRGKRADRPHAVVVASTTTAAASNKDPGFLR
jgi:hypothetical protein